MKTHVSNGDSLTITFPYARSAGEGVMLGSIFGVAYDDTDNAAEGQIKTRGVFLLEKTATKVFAQGAAVFWDDSAKSVTDVAAGNRRVGSASVAAASDDALAEVLLDGHAGPVSADDNISA